LVFPEELAQTPALQDWAGFWCDGLAHIGDAGAIGAAITAQLVLVDVQLKTAMAAIWALKCGADGLECPDGSQPGYTDYLRAAIDECEFGCPRREFNPAYCPIECNQSVAGCVMSFRPHLAP
jgi:hypothetical protein